MEKDVFEMSRDVHGAKFLGDFIDASNLYLSNRNSMRDGAVIPFENMELSIAEEMSSRLSKIEKLNESGAKRVAKLANRLMRDQTCLGCGSDDKKEGFVSNMLLSYLKVEKSGHKLDVNDDLAMLKFSHELAVEGGREQVIGGLCTRLDDKKVADEFLKFAEEDLNRLNDKGQDILSGDLLIEKFAEIVKHHPEMAKKCNELVNKTADLQGCNGHDAYVYGAAHNYFEQVKEMDGVSDYDKTMAKVRSKTWDKRAQKAEELGKQKAEKEHFQAKTTEIDFREMDFGMER